MSISTPDWVKDAIFYQIFPDRFAKSDRFGKDYPQKPNNLQPWGAPPTFYGFQGGDLLGIVERLDYIEALGVNAIYLNPIFTSASNHRYHTHDYFTVDPILGGNQAFKEFLEAAHARHIRVILDGVFNHASRGFFQFNHLLECGPESPYADWFHVHGWPLHAYDNDRSPHYDAWWGIASLPKFNTNTPQVREYLWRVGEYWLEQGVDGWRLDVPNEIDDDEFWREFRRRCKAINPDMYIVGELWGDAQRWLRGDQFDAQMNYNFTRAVFGYISGDAMDQTDTGRTGYGHMNTLNGYQCAGELNRIFNEIYDYEIVLSQMNMLGSHDTPRTLTVANMDVNAVRLMYLAQMTMPGAPNVYYGDEIGMAGRHDPDCRGAFPWENDAEWNGSLLADLKQYIQLRKDHVSLRRGGFRILHATHHVVMYAREYEGETAVIAFNNAHHPEPIHIPSDWQTVLPDKLVSDGQPFRASTEIEMAPRSGRVWIG